MASGGVTLPFPRKSDTFSVVMRSLRYKIGASYFILVLIGLGTSVFALYTFTQLRGTVESLLQSAVDRTVAAEHLVRAVDRQEIAQTTALIDFADWELYQAYFNDGRDEFLRSYDQARQQMGISRQPTILDSLLLTYRSYLQSSDSLFALMKYRSRVDIAKRFQKFVVRPIAEQLKNECFRFLEANQAAMVRAELTVRTATFKATLAVIFASLASIVISFFASVQFTRTIIKPAERLTASVRKISQGHMQQKIDVTTDDEIGVLSSEFNKMTERLRMYEQINIQQLIAEKSKSETIVANIADPVLVTDEQNRLVLMNQAAARALNLENTLWQGRSIRSVLPNDRWADLLEADGVMKSERDHRDPLLPVVQNGTTLYFRPRQARILDERGEPQGCVTLLQDVTRFKDLDRMKSEFVATVSHELRTPLTSLSMGVDILSKEVIGPVTERQREILFAAKDDCERLRKLVKDLLDLSKLESGKYEMKKERINLSHLVADTLRPLSLPFREKHIALTTDVPADLPVIVGDEQQLSWVLTNLLTNALRFTDPGGNVRLTVVHRARELSVSVSDTGRGIPPEAKEMIFEKFVQVKDATDSTPGSVGLGLSIAREVVEAHGGSIWVESTIGVGSTFTFTLPVEKD